MSRLNRDLAELERTNPAVKAAAENYARAVREALDPVHGRSVARMRAKRPRCTCETFGNGCVSGNDGRLEPPEGCPRHSRPAPSGEQDA